jgi:hypothetical protein
MQRGWVKLVIATAGCTSTSESLLVSERMILLAPPANLDPQRAVVNVG